MWMHVCVYTPAFKVSIFKIKYNTYEIDSVWIKTHSLSVKYYYFVIPGSYTKFPIE